jgi:predicted dehydrogenase
MSAKVRWGVLGVANIAMNKVVPGMQRGEYTEIAAIASRDLEKARGAAAKLGIAKAYGSYEALLADPEIAAIYIPLPNHLHVPWSIKALEAGKHVLCEKPIGMSSAEARQLIEARDKSGRKACEAFMASSHPQWLRAREIVRSGTIGDLRAITGFFSYFNRKPENVRNIAAIGGGGLMDIGCYPLNLTRMIFGEEPRRVAAIIERDPDFKTDRLTTVLLDFPSGQATFTVSTQLVPYQRMQIFGTRGRIEVDIPFNALPDRPMRLLVDDGSSILGAGIRVEEVAVCDQYTIQGDLFSRAILDDGRVAVPIEEAMQTMRLIEAILRSAETGRWETLGPE